MGNTIIPKYEIQHLIKEMRSELVGDERPRNILKQIRRIEEEIMDLRERGNHRSFLYGGVMEHFGQLMYDMADFWGHENRDDTRENAAETAYDILYKYVDKIDNKRYEYMVEE